MPAQWFRYFGHYIWCLLLLLLTCRPLHTLLSIFYVGSGSNKLACGHAHGSLWCDSVVRVCSRLPSGCWCWAREVLARRCTVALWRRSSACFTSSFASTCRSWWWPRRRNVSCRNARRHRRPPNKTCRPKNRESLSRPKSTLCHFYFSLTVLTSAVNLSSNRHFQPDNHRTFVSFSLVLLLAFTFRILLRLTVDSCNVRPFFLWWAL